MDSLAEQRVAILRRRLRAGSAIAIASILIFSIVDWRFASTPPPLLLTRLAQVCVAFAVFVGAPHLRHWAAVANTTLAFVVSLAITALGTAILRGETQSVPVLVTMIALVTATFATWGLRRQLVLSAVGFAAVVVNLAALDALHTALPYPFLPITVALGVSAWVAAESDRHGRARYHAEVALRASEERFRTLAEHAPVPIWMSGLDGVITYLNPAWDPLLTGELSLDRRFWLAVHPDDRARLAAEAHAALVARDGYESEYRLLAPDGSMRWLAIRGVPRVGPDGRYDGHVGTAVDVTESKAEARSLAAAHGAAVEAGRLKSHFLATMSHEIRNPMHGIFGMTELALDTDDEQERRDFIRRARSCAKTLMTLLDEILDLSRIEAGKLDLVQEPVDLAEVLENAVDTIAMAASQKGLELIVEIAPAVPTTVGSDGRRLRQILTNLLANAVKFTDAGEVALEAAVRDDTLILSVRDTGIGIDPSALPDIFEPFTQADRSIGSRFGGTGLGLAISHRLATGLGGRITVESTVGRGTRFDVLLPLREPIGPTMSVRYRDVRGLHVLVADGAAARHASLQRLFVAYGCRVTIARSVTDAEGAFRSGGRGGAAPDAVVADVDLEADARGVESRLRAAAGTTDSLLVLTSPLRPGVRSEAGDPGTRIVTRPVLPHLLFEALLDARARLAATGS